jgi:hypothetical protein
MLLSHLPRLSAVLYELPHCSPRTIVISRTIVLEVQTKSARVSLRKRGLIWCLTLVLYVTQHSTRFRGGKPEIEICSCSSQDMHNLFIHHNRKFGKRKAGSDESPRKFQTFTGPEQNDSIHAPKVLEHFALASCQLVHLPAPLPK